MFFCDYKCVNSDFGHKILVVAASNLKNAIENYGFIFFLLLIDF